MAIRAENIECVEVIGEGKNEWALAVHVRGRYEPYKLLGNQLHLARLYNILLDHNQPYRASAQKGGDNMENTARIKTAKGNKIRVSDIGDFRIVDRKSMMDMILNFNQLLIEYETEEDFREVFPQSNNDQHFLLAQKKDDELKQRQRDLEMALDATPNIHYTSLVHESPHMAIVKKLKSSMQYERYYILAAGSESECKEYKKKAEEKQNRFEMKGEAMNESPLPKLTEGKEKVKQKIQERITRGEELLGTLETSIDEYSADLVDECSR